MNRWIRIGVILASLSGCATSSSGTASSPAPQQESRESRESLVQRLRLRIAKLETEADAMHAEAGDGINEDAMAEIRKEIATLKAKLKILEAATDDKASAVKRGIQDALLDLKKSLQKLKDKL